MRRAGPPFAGRSFHRKLVCSSSLDETAAYPGNIVPTDIEPPLLTDLGPECSLAVSDRRLRDAYGRVHDNLRISVIDKCNIRCFYCMPAENVRFLPEAKLLSFDAIERVARLLCEYGVRKIRITGGEPLLRRDLAGLIARLSAIPQLSDLALTTNGMLLEEQADDLARAGLKRINISLDTLSDETFQKISRRRGIDRVLAGIAAAQEAGFERVRLNALAIAGLTEHELIPLVEFARQRDLTIRFIEFMPLDGDHRWSRENVLTGRTLQHMLQRHFGPLSPQRRDDPAQPAEHYRFRDGRGGVGFITPVSAPFCKNCNRLRLTAEGRLRNCLFSTAEWDLKPMLDDGADDGQLLASVRSCLDAKRLGHLVDQPGFVRPERAMYSIGG